MSTRRLPDDLPRRWQYLEDAADDAQALVHLAQVDTVDQVALTLGAMSAHRVRSLALAMALVMAQGSTLADAELAP